MAVYPTGERPKDIVHAMLWYGMGYTQCKVIVDMIAPEIGLHAIMEFDHVWDAMLAKYDGDEQVLLAAVTMAADIPREAIIKALNDMEQEDMWS